jgi:choline dehydrogenase
VRIASADATQAPKITPNYLTTEEDRQVAADALRLTRRIVAAPAMQRYAPQEFLPGPAFQTDAELARAAGDIGTTIFHPVGTCKMGRDDDAMAVLDPQLRVRGVAGLRVVDGSIMPLITSGNPNSPIIMIADKAAQMIRADRKNPAPVLRVETALA